MIRRLLSYPQARHLDLDDPSTTRLRRDILQNNALLKQVYRTWYETIIQEIPQIDGKIVELGTGPGFLKEIEAELITSDLLWVPGIDLVLNGQALPFADQSLRAIVMTNVLHHIPRVSSFFFESVRCLVAGGKMIMIEPWLTEWSRFIYQNFHHEPMEPNASIWTFPSDGPLSSANEALPWMVFSRDRQTFETSYPQLSINRIEPIMPFLYLLTGGFSSRIYLPGWTFPILRKAEELLIRWRFQLGMFAVIVLSKKEAS